MSTAEQLAPQPDEPEDKPPPLPPEVQRARAEDERFAETLGRARAKARGEEYDPEIHHPDRFVSRYDVKPEAERALAEILERYRTRGAIARPPLDRPDTERSYR
jgi:hypothetical protein